MGFRADGFRSLARWSVWIATQWLVIGSREGGWADKYLDTFDTRAIESFLISSVFASAALAASWPRLKRVARDPPAGRTSTDEWALILGWCLLAVALQGLIRSLTPFTFGTIFANDASTRSTASP